MEYSPFCVLLQSRCWPTKYGQTINSNLASVQQLDSIILVRFFLIQIILWRESQ